MPFNTTNLFLSLAMLNNAKIPQDKKLAAAAGAAMMPGILGLALPLIVARNSTRDATKPGAGSGTSPQQTPDGPMQTKVPNVRDFKEAAAVDTIVRAGLTPVISRVYFKAIDGTPVPPAGQVASQEPMASADWVDEGSTVKIEVSLGAPPAETGSGTDEHAHHTALETEINTRMSEMGSKVDLILSKVGKTNSETVAKH